MDDPRPFRILLDECVQAGVALALNEDGHDVVRPAQAGTKQSPTDEALLEAAVEDGRILVTTDTDLCGVHARWASEGRTHLGI